MNKSESISILAASLIKAQKEIGGAKKDAKNPFFHSTYADLGAVMEACKNALNDNGIVVLQPIGSDEIGVYVETVLLHESGEFISDRMRISVKEENNPQAQGSAITYARRYSLQSMVFIPAEDDDGESAMKRSSTPPVKPQPKPTGIKAEIQQDMEKREQNANNDFLQCSDCGAAISEKVAKYSESKFGRPLCFDDQKKQ